MFMGKLHMRIFKYRTFHHWAKKQKIKDNILIKAIENMECGLFNVNLGAGLYKQRIARKGEGKRGGYRIILAFKSKKRAIFMYGYDKNLIDNLSNKEELVYKKLAGYFLEMLDNKIDVLINNCELFEIIYEN